MSTLRTTNIIHGSSAISNIVLDNQGRAIFGPDSPQGRAALYVNAQTNRVGVNTETPAVALDVAGAINATGNVAFGGTFAVTGNTTLTGLVEVGNDIRTVGWNGSSALGFRLDSGGALLLNQPGTGASLSIRRNGTENASISGSGNADFSGDVEVGSQFRVVGSANASANVRIQYNGSTTEVSVHKGDGTLYIGGSNLSSGSPTPNIRLSANGESLFVGDMTISRVDPGNDVFLRIKNNTGTDAGTTCSLRLSTSPGAFDTSVLQADRSTGSTSFYYGTTKTLELTSAGALKTGAGLYDSLASDGGIDAGSGLISLLVGGNSGGGSNQAQARVDNGNKEGRIALCHRTNTEEPIGLVTGFSQGSENFVFIGGGSSIINAATEVGLYTAANNTTTGGTSRLRINSEGYILAGPQTGNALTYPEPGSSSNTRTPTLQIQGINGTTIEGGVLLNFTNNQGDEKLMMGVLFNSVATGPSIRAVVENSGNNAYGMKFFTSPSYLTPQQEVMNMGANGTITIPGSLNVTGTKNFSIKHPLESKKETHQLIHTCIEGPKADLIYRGKTQLIKGEALVNIDEKNGMTEGTFVALVRDVQCFTTNETDWCPIKGSIEGNILTITAQDPACESIVSWMVIGERKDQSIIDAVLTDEDGHVIVEVLNEDMLRQGTELAD